MEGLPPVLRDGPLLLLSPHPDDAALSCAALLARQAPIDVFTVFMGRPDPPRQGSWDRQTGFPSSAVSIPARVVEEQTAFAGTPHRVELLDLHESQYLDGARDPHDARVLAAAISSWLERTGGGVVAVPAGAGRAPGRVRHRLRRLVGATLPAQHPDHLFVRDAALAEVLPRPDARPLLYEEFPYRWGAPADGVVRRIAREHGRSADLVTVEVDRRAKVDRIGIYSSQVGPLTVRGRRIDVEESLPTDERYWLLR
jgi:LmbE family N-acetylglucosaminyl deacetylase